MKKFILTLVFMVIAGVAVIIIGVQMVGARLYDQIQVTRPTEFEVSPGDSWESILAKLEQEEIVESTLGVSLYLRFQDMVARAGTYTVEPGMDLFEVLTLISEGVEKKELTMTIPEGSYVTDIADEVERVFGIPANDFNRAVDRFDTRAFDFFPDEANSLEGYLFPDTYSFFPDVTSEEIIATMLATFRRKALPSLSSTSNGLSPYETMILASIVEKEVYKPEERAVVAGIFMNRLEINMMLQSDATVNYLTRSGRDRSTLDDLDIDSAYNTYKYQGLPPGPIANPGVAAIEAAANPAETEYFFFLTTPWPNSQTYFAVTFEEHVRNRNLYLE
jgi:UPF0755 protein